MRSCENSESHSEYLLVTNVLKWEEILPVQLLLAKQADKSNLFNEFSFRKRKKNISLLNSESQK